MVMREGGKGGFVEALAACEGALVAQEKTVLLVYLNGCVSWVGKSGSSEGGEMLVLKHLGRFRPCVFSAPFHLELAFFFFFFDASD